MKRIILLTLLLTSPLLAQEGTNTFLIDIGTNRLWGTLGVGHIMTNMISSSITNYPVNTVKWLIERGTLTNTVKELAAEGYICGIMGHNWEMVYSTTLEYRPDGNYPQYRKCVICGKEQTKVSDWK